MNIPLKYEDVVAQLGAERELHKLATETLGQYADENQKLHANLAALREELGQCGSMAAMIEDKEWAEHAGTGPVSSRVESAFTRLHNELSEARQRLTAADERTDVLEGLLRLIPRRATAYDTEIDAALKPAAEVAAYCTHPPGCKQCS